MASVSLLSHSYSINPQITEAIHSKFYRSALLLDLAALKLAPKGTILCIEVGHTRFKATLISYPTTVKELKATKTIAGLSAPWLQNNFSSLFARSIQSPLSELFAREPNGVSLSLFGPISNHMQNVFWHGKFPENLKLSLENATSRPVMIDGDAVSWAIGAMEYLKSESSEMTFPCLAVTLGTGYGIALINGVGEVRAIEFWAMNVFYKRLSQFLTDPNLRTPGHMLSKYFLDGIAGGEEFLDQKMESYRSTFNEHFQAFVSDACEEIEAKLELSKPISCVLVGGGHSRFIDTAEGDRKMEVLSPQRLTESGFSPDIIQLLGTLRSCQTPTILTSTYPSTPEILTNLKGDSLVHLKNHVRVIQDLFQIDHPLQFERVSRDEMNSPVHIFYESNGVKKSLGVFKEESDIASSSEVVDQIPQRILNRFDSYLSIIGARPYSCVV